MDEENNAPPQGESEPQSIASIEDKLGSFDFDAPPSPAGEQKAPPEPVDAEVEAPFAEEAPTEKPLTDDDPEETLRDGTKVKRSELKRAYRPDWETQVKTFAEQQAAFQRATAGYSQAQQQAAAQLQQVVGILQERMPKAPDPELSKTDPFEYLQQKTRYDTELGKLQQARAAQAHFAQQAHHQQRQAFQKRLIQERDATLRVFPDLKDPVKATRFAEDTKTLGVKLGFSEKELSGINDHRLVRLIHMALQAERYEKAQETAKAKAVKAAAERPPVEVQAPQRRRSPSQVDADTRRAALLRLSKNPNSAKAAEDVLSRFD